LVKRTGRDLTGNLNYTYSRQRGDTFSAQQEFNGYYSGVQDFQNLSAAANSLTGYDATHIVKGYFAYQLPFGKGKRWLSNKSGFLNGLVSGWQAAGLVLYQTGQPMRIGLNTPFYPIWSNFYPNFHPTGKFTFSPSGYDAATAASDPNYIYHYMSSSVASSPIVGNNIAFGTGGLSDGRLRCPGYANENASILKSLGFAEGKYQLQMRVEFYNLLNRHYYDINGCGGRQTNVGDTNFAAVLGVNSKPRNGQFGIRFSF